MLKAAMLSDGGPMRAGKMSRRPWHRSSGAERGEVIFTSGGTEANNLAVFGLAGAETSPGHVISSTIEHPAIAEPISRLEAAGFAVHRLAVDRQGLANAVEMAEVFRADTRFATLMLANNETGAIQPVEDLVAQAMDGALRFTLTASKPWGASRFTSITWA